MKNRITATLEQDKKLLNVYFTAGYPNLNDTALILKTLSEQGVDMVEIGIPYSDPLADGPTIQACAEKALSNGMTLDLLFKQLKGFRKNITIPVVLMGYYNSMLNFGIEEFCQKCQEVGIDGVIFPDLPMKVYQRECKSIFEKYALKIVPLITPYTSIERAKEYIGEEYGFTYVVSTPSTTGSSKQFDRSVLEKYIFELGEVYGVFNKMIGFGIKDNDSYEWANKHSDGAIIGSTFLKSISKEQTFADLEKNITFFIKKIRNI